MHMRVPDTKAALQQFKQLTSTYPPPEVHVRDQHTIIVWKKDRKRRYVFARTKSGHTTLAYGQHAHA